MVTGPSGFVGKRVLERLGPEAVGVSHSSGLGRSVGSWEPENLAKALEGGVGVVHAGAVVPGASTRDEDFYRGNVEGTRVLLEGARRAGLRRFVLLSTIKVHGEVPAGPIDERTPIAPGTAYGASKAEAERLVLAADDLQPVVLRLCPVYGRGDKGNVRRLIRAVARGRFVVPGSGRTRKSIVHVSTVAEVVQAVIRSQNAAGVYVVADTPAPTLRELADTVARLLGKRPPPALPALALRVGGRGLKLAGRVVPQAQRLSSLLERAMGDSVCDPARAVRDLGVTCSPDLEEMLRDEIDRLRDLEGSRGIPHPPA
jgi:nucleoside-diphosphate-sugar epimerase